MKKKHKFIAENCAEVHSFAFKTANGYMGDTLRTPNQPTAGNSDNPTHTTRSSRRRNLRTPTTKINFRNDANTSDSDSDSDKVTFTPSKSDSNSDEFDSSEDTLPVFDLRGKPEIHSMNTIVEWTLQRDGTLAIYKIKSVDIAERVHANTQAAAKSNATDLNKLLNHGNDTVPVSINTGAVTSWLTKLVAQEGLVVLKKQRVADNSSVRVSGETDAFKMVYPNDTAVLFDALDALVPLNVETDDVSHARIEAHMSRNMAIGDGIRLDALSRAVPPSAAQRPYEAHRHKNSAFDESIANAIRRQFWELVKDCFKFDESGKSYAAQYVWKQSAINNHHAISTAVFGPQKCPSNYNITANVNATSDAASDKDIYILTRSEDGLQITTELHLKITSDACTIGKEASLWYDALSWAITKLDKTAPDTTGPVDYVLPSTLTESDIRNAATISKQEIEKKVATTSGQHYAALYLPSVIYHDDADTVISFMTDYYTCNACEFCALNDPNYCSNRWILDDNEKTKLTIFLNGSKDKLRDILVFARTVINVEREHKKQRNINTIQTLQSELEQLKDGDSLTLLERSNSITASQINLGSINDIEELHYGNETMKTSVVALWSGSNYNILEQHIASNARTIFSLSQHKITRHIAHILVPFRAVVTGPKHNHQPTLCDVEGYFLVSSAFLMAYSSTIALFYEVNIGETGISMFKTLLNLKKDDVPAYNDTQIMLTASLLLACHRAVTRLAPASGSVTGTTKVERDGLESMKHAALMAFVQHCCQ